MPRHLQFCALMVRRLELMRDLEAKSAALKAEVAKVHARLEQSRISLAHSSMLLSHPVRGAADLQCSAPTRPVSSDEQKASSEAAS
jgi:hypothetical protein